MLSWAVHAACMGIATNPPVEQARSIFADLGYEIAGDGTTFSATRAWKEIRVSAVAETPETDASTGYRCFVTWADQVDEVGMHLEEGDLAGEWALIGVDRDGEYEVARAPTSS